MDQTSGSVAKTAKKQRVLTDKRREQNKIHQRLHREKKKRFHNEQLPKEQLPSKAVETVQSDGSAVQPIEWTDVVAEASSLDFENSILNASAWPKLAEEESFDIPLHQRLSLLEQDEASADTSLGVDQAFDSWDPDSMFEYHDPTWTELGSASPNMLSMTTDTSASMENDESFTFDEDTAEPSVISANPHKRRYLLSEVLQAGLESIKRQQDSSDKSLIISDPNASPLLSPADIALDFHGSDGFAQDLHHLIQDGQISIEPYIADPKANHLRLNKMSILGSCLANASMLRVEVELAPSSYDSEHGKRPSEFPLSLASLGSIAAVLSSFSHVSSDLQPCAEQLEDQHALYVDLLPFPEFRKRLMAMRKIQPPVFSEDELCEDIASDGLFCWGTRGTGTPWDSRSWEARPWFLEKWWMLTGGKDGNMWTQSKWYWNLRDEEDYT